jgi:hypothetical protein
MISLLGGLDELIFKFDIMNFKSVFSLLAFLSWAFFSKAEDIYVSPFGNDANLGSKDFPLKSVLAAQKMAESILEGRKESSITIWLDAGVYPISEPLVFHPFYGRLQFKALSEAPTIISGGLEIEGWKKNEEGLWEAPLPRALEGREEFRELFLSGKRLTRARFPNDSYLRVSKAGPDRRTSFYFEKGDFPIPSLVGDVELVLLHDWSISRIALRQIDSAANQLFAVESIGAKSPDFFTIDNWEPHPRYFLENAREFLDADFEWVFLKKEKKFLLTLPLGQNPADYQVMVPVSEGLVSIIGSESQPVSDISFEGITFQFSRWEIPSVGYSGVQACHFDPRPSEKGWAVVPAAIRAEWVENISFERCEFRNLGGTGIWLGAGSKNCSVSNSDLADISGNGIMIGEGQDRLIGGEPWWKVDPTQAAQSNRVENNRISEVGAQFYGAVGIWGGLTAKTIIRGNQLTNMPYTGISVGWMWSPVATPARENILSGNHIHDIMKILSDGGGIYMLGLQPGSKIFDNRIHGVQVNAGRAESNGIFLDEGITDVVVERNLVYDIAKSPLRFHRATVNLVRKNYFFTTGDNPPVRYNTTREEDIRKVSNHFFEENNPGDQRALEKSIGKWERKVGKKLGPRHGR